MSQALVSPSDCCAPCNEAPITQIPGPKGDPGTCDPCADGLNAFTATTDSFEMPNVEALVSVEVADSVWASVGQVVFVSGAGYFRVDSIPDSTHLSLLNLGYPGNATPTTIIASIQTVSPGGLQGPEGPTPPTDTLNDISPTTTQGDLLADNGANDPDASLVRLGVGTDGQIFTAQSSQATGLQWQTLLPNGATDNILPRFDDPGATAEPSPLQASALLVTDDGALQSTPTGGNARGSKAIDLQVDRVAATQVASGDKSGILCGNANTASALNAIAAGSGNLASGIASVAIADTNVASGQGAIAIGTGNTASGDQSVAIGPLHQATATSAACLGGSQNIASADYSTCLGGLFNTAAMNYSTVMGSFSFTDFHAQYGIASGLRAVAHMYGQRAHASGLFSASGDAQFSDILFRIATSDATPNVEMFLDGAAELANLWDFGSWAFHILTVARNMASDASAVWETKGGIKRSGAPASIIGGAVTQTLVANDGEGWMLVGALLVDAGPSTNLRLRVTGAALTDIRWVSHVRLVEVDNI